MFCDIIKPYISLSIYIYTFFKILFPSPKSLTLLATQDTPGNKGQQQPITLLTASTPSVYGNGIIWQL